ncbi:MAG: glycosyltransferase family 2 protein, partial [Alphaproteobacteria bacterium]
ARGLPNHRDKPIDLTYWVERNFNVVEDRRILRHAPARRAVEAELIAVGEVRALHQAAVAWHRQRFRSLLRHRAELELFGRLVLAGGSTPPDDALARELVELYQEATP